MPPKRTTTTTTDTTATPPEAAATVRRRTKRNPAAAKKLSEARARLRGVVREDSDDELGSDDLPWEWIYSTTATATASGKSNGSGSRTPRIVGARMGSFDVRIGDCLLIKGEGLKGEAYVGMACEFEEEEEEEGDDRDGGMMCNVMWFSTESEIPPGPKKRTDFFEVRLFPP